MNYEKEIQDKFIRCPICKEFCCNIKLHMHLHVGKEIPQEEYDRIKWN